MIAKERAQKAWNDAHGESKDGKYDVKVYNEKLVEVYAELKKKTYLAHRTPTVAEDS